MVIYYHTLNVFISCLLINIIHIYDFSPLFIRQTNGQMLPDSLMGKVSQTDAHVTDVWCKFDLYS